MGPLPSPCQGAAGSESSQRETFRISSARCQGSLVSQPGPGLGRAVVEVTWDRGKVWPDRREMYREDSLDCQGGGLRTGLWGEGDLGWLLAWLMGTHDPHEITRGPGRVCEGAAGDPLWHLGIRSACMDVGPSRCTTWRDPLARRAEPHPSPGRPRADACGHQVPAGSRHTPRLGRFIGVCQRLLAGGC